MGILLYYPDHLPINSGQPHYFFTHSTTLYPWLHQWKEDLPPQLDLGQYKDTVVYQEVVAYLLGLRLDVNILTKEDLLFHYGLSPVPTKLAFPLGTQLNPKF